MLIRLALEMLFTGVSKTLWGRALLDITFGPEVKKIFKIRAVQKLDVFLPGCLLKLKPSLSAHLLALFASVFRDLFASVSLVPKN